MARAAAPPELPDPDTLINRGLISSGSTGGCLADGDASVGVTISSLFNYPEYLGTSIPHLGRLRSAPREWRDLRPPFPRCSSPVLLPAAASVQCVRMWKEAGATGSSGSGISGWSGDALLALGHNQGLEAGEFPFVVDAVIFVVIGLLTVQFL